MLLDNSMVSDNRVEKEIETLNNHFNVCITVLAIKDNNLVETEIKNGFEVNRIIDPIVKSPLKKGYKKYLVALSNEILNYSFDILHCHDYHMLFIGNEIKKIKPDVNLIYDSHEYLRGWPLYLTNNGIINKIKGYLVWKKELRLEKKAIHNTDKVITVTKSIAKSLQKNYQLCKTPTVLSNFPKLTNLVKTDFLKKKFNIDKEKKILIHSGSIYYSNKQLSQLTETINEFKDVVLVFIGNRPRFYEVKEMFSKISSLNEKVFFIDYPSDYKSLFSLLYSADIGLLHVRNKWKAHKMGSANKFIEYSHAGLAIISTYQNTAIEINNEYHHCEFYDENQFFEFKLALKKTLNNLHVLKNNAQKTREFINWDSESKKLVEYYNTII